MGIDKGGGSMSKRGANALYYGDNLDILRRKIKDETVDLCLYRPARGPLK